MECQGKQRGAFIGEFTVAYFAAKAIAHYLILIYSKFVIHVPQDWLTRLETL